MLSGRMHKHFNWRIVISPPVAVCTVFIGLAATVPVLEVKAGETGTLCHGDPFVSTKIRPNYFLPCDYQGTISRAGLYRFAWNTFVAMSWPALPENAKGSTRGMPDRESQYGLAGTVPVWDTWRGKRELFRTTKSPAKHSNKHSSKDPTKREKATWVWSTAHPGPFNALPATADPNPDVKPCAGIRDKPGAGIMQTNKIDNYVDETDEIGLAVVWSKTDPITRGAAHIPTENSIIRYQVKFNADHWNYVIDKGIYATVALNKLIADKSFSKLGGVDFPAGSNSDAVTGSIMTKSAWKMISEAEAAKGNYYTTEAFYYVPTTKNHARVCYKPATFALIGLHIIRKTDTFGLFFFSTFEHKDNYPNKFYYANTNSPSGKLHSIPSSILPSGYNIPYTTPADPVVNIPKVQNMYQANRLVPASMVLNTVNSEADTVNQGTVWENYRLVGAQYKPVDGKNGDVDPVPDQDFFLANPVIETNQRFQFFDGAFATADTKNVNTEPQASASPTFNMGGCMGCHGAGAQLAGSEFSFTLGNVISNPKARSAAETLADKCTEIGLKVSSDGLICKR